MDIYLAVMPSSKKTTVCIEIVNYFGNGRATIFVFVFFSQSNLKMDMVQLSFIDCNN